MGPRPARMHQGWFLGLAQLRRASVVECGCPLPLCSPERGLDAPSCIRAGPRHGGFTKDGGALAGGRVRALLQQAPLLTPAQRQAWLPAQGDDALEPADGTEALPATTAFTPLRGRHGQTVLGLVGHCRPLSPHRAGRLGGRPVPPTAPTALTRCVRPARLCLRSGRTSAGGACRPDGPEAALAPWQGLTRLSRLGASKRGVFTFFCKKP